MKKVLALLGLAETATEDEAVAQIHKLIDSSKGADVLVTVNKATVEALGLKADASASEITGTILAMKQSHTQQNSLATEVELLKNKLKAREDADVELLVNSAILGDAKGSKLTPAQKDWAMAYAKRDTEGFKVFLNAAPYQIRKGSVVPDVVGGPADGVMDETALKVCRMFGNNPDDVKKTMRAA